MYQEVPRLRLGVRKDFAFSSSFTFYRKRPGETKIRKFAVTLRVQQNVGRFLISMNHVSRMKKLCRLEELIHDVLFVDSFQNIALLDNMMQICFHKLKNQIEILII